MIWDWIKKPRKSIQTPAQDSSHNRIVTPSTQTILHPNSILDRNFRPAYTHFLKKDRLHNAASIIC